MKKTLLFIGVVAAILLAALYTAGLMGFLRGYEATLNIRASSDLMGRKAYVHVLAFYPSGFRDIAKHVLDFTSDGKASLRIDLSDLVRSWSIEYRVNGRHAQPFIILAGYTEDGRVFVKGVEVYGRVMNVVIEPLKDVDVLKGIVSVEEGERIARACGLSRLGKCWESRELVASFERVMPVIIAKIEPDGRTQADGMTAILKNEFLGFSVNTFIGSEWMKIGYLRLAKNTNKSLTYMIGRNETYYIWINVRFRYEKWHVHSICTGRVIEYYEEYITVVDFYPATLSAGTNPPPDAKMPEIDSMTYEGVFYSSDPEKPYYQWALSLNATGIDALGFVEMLSSSGLITDEAASTARSIGLFITVDLTERGMIFYIGFHGDARTWHEIYIARTHDIEEAPLLYFTTHLK